LGDSQGNPVSRRYESPVRTEQVARTRRRVAEAAASLFVRDGYESTTVAAVAREAGVSAQTVYNAWATKADLLKGAYDVTLVGDDEPVPLARRPEVQALYALTDAEDLLRGYASLGRRLLERVGPLMRQVGAGAAAGVPDLLAHAETMGRERLVGTGMVARRLDELGALPAGRSVEQVRDRIWTLNSVEVWSLLTVTLGWSADAYEEWVGEAMCAAALDPPGRRRHGAAAGG
jgi:AcrR family transcriptional regulator